MSRQISIEHTAKVVVTLECDTEDCPNSITVEKVVHGPGVWTVDQTGRDFAQNEARSKGWVFRSYGPKGIFHYCPTCMQKPELAVWHMQKILTKP